MNMHNTAFQLRNSAIYVALMVLGTGCGGPRAVTGGTQGVLRSGDVRLAEIQVTFYQLNGETIAPVGFGATRSDGTFELVTNGAKGPLRLSAGKYRCTIESIGSPLAIPVQYRNPNESPINFTWNSNQRLVELDVPGLSL